MTKVNIKTLIATHEAIPMALFGLSCETLRNLQTELNPVPSEFKDIEFWDEVDVTPTFDASTHVLDGTETLTAVKASKTVEVIKGIRTKTAEELAADRKAMVPHSITKIQAMKAMKLTDVYAVSGTNMWTTFQAVLAANPDANDEWVLAQILERSNPFVSMLSPALNKSDDQIDELFILGGTL